jgi:hypothetical protein
MAKSLAKPRATKVAKRTDYRSQVGPTGPLKPHDELQHALASVCQEAPFERYEQILGLRAPNPEFRRHVSQAITLCIVSQFRPRVKDSVIRRALIRVSKVAEAVAQDLRTLHIALDDVAPQYRKWLGQDWRGSVPVAANDLKLEAIGDSERVSKLLADRAARLNIEPTELADLAARFGELSAIANRHAKIRKKTAKGGAPKMAAFSALVTGLERAFKIATGRSGKVTWNHADDTYGGSFLSLVEAVLPLAEGLAKNCGSSLRSPRSRLALGKYVSEQTRAGKKRHVLYTA